MSIMNKFHSGKQEHRTLYLVTSVAGFMGGTVCRQLLERGEQVRGFVLKGDPGAKYVPREVEIIAGDVRDKESLERFFTVPSGVETIVLHIASIVSMNPEYNQTVMDVNVGGVNNIIEMCLSHPECKKLVYVSSTGAIPEAAKGLKIREVNHFEPDKVLGCYSQSKAIATQAVLDAVRERNLNACVVYPTGIMGPGDFALSGETTQSVLKIVREGMPVGINGSFNLADVRDLAHGIILAADKGKSGEGYILGNEAIMFKQFADAVCAECGQKKIKMFLPIWAANLMALMMEKRAKRKGEKPLMTRFSIYNLARNNDFDSTKAKRELGYEVRGYAETIQDMIAWLKKTGRLEIQGKPTYNQAEVSMKAV